MMQWGRITISGANFEPMGTAMQLRHYTSPEDPRNNLGASTTREGERERGLGEPRTRTVNPGITPCGLGAPEGIARSRLRSRDISE